MIDDSLLKILICPDCKGELVQEKTKLKCKKCKHVFLIKNGIPVLLSKQQ